MVLFTKHSISSKREIPFTLHLITIVLGWNVSRRYNLPHWRRKWEILKDERKLCRISCELEFGFMGQRVGVGAFRSTHKGMLEIICYF